MFAGGSFVSRARCSASSALLRRTGTPLSFELQEAGAPTLQRTAPRRATRCAASGARRWRHARRTKPAQKAQQSVVFFRSAMIAVGLGIAAAPGRPRRVIWHPGVSVPPVAAIGVRIARAQIFAICVGVELRAIA